MAQVRTVNPWTWQDAFGFSQAVEVTGANRVLFCSGQTSVDAEGNPLHPGDMTAQLGQALDNLETVLAQAGLALRNVVRLNYYTTDVATLRASLAALAERFERADCCPPGTLLGVSALFHPDLMVEIEATAVA